eukprot:CAMPEP_0174702014 /NCGR_PEP_ID=MMETSP1094-20130205/6451_1 /TAXON_ID=156173 /ORGANISM="Chrysochromulina brevifilum, Strain UTEX LB 985" /LENGTH=54 /DNA_ID=CAMNT_0015899737 /DNA_START=93 /DNA_END=257 /DNA_ORIENTATION=-
MPRSAAGATQSTCPSHAAQTIALQRATDDSLAEKARDKIEERTQKATSLPTGHR